MDASVAPRFETAETMVVCTIVEGQVIESETQPCSGCEGFSRVRLLREHQVDTLICNGIRSLYRNLLQSLEIVVLDGVSMTVDAALDKFTDGGLNPAETVDDNEGMECEVLHEDLVCWAEDNLVACGWRVRPADSDAPFAVDLIAAIECPVCRRPIRAAICCGAHIYRCDREIREFHHATINDFHVRLYVHSTSPRLAECCRSFGIQLVDPDSSPAAEVGKINARHVPPVTVPVGGHDQLEPTESEASNEPPHSQDK